MTSRLSWDSRIKMNFLFWEDLDRCIIMRYLNDTGQIDSLDSIFTCKTTGSAPLPINLDFINEEALSEVSIDTIIRNGGNHFLLHFLYVKFSLFKTHLWQSNSKFYFNNCMQVIHHCMRHDFKCWDYDEWREGYILYFPNSRVEHQFWREYVTHLFLHLFDF